MMFMEEVDLLQISALISEESLIQRWIDAGLLLAMFHLVIHPFLNNRIAAWCPFAELFSEED